MPRLERGKIIQFSVHLTRLFQSWLESSKINENFKSLKEFMVLDQFLASLNPDLRTFIKEHRPSSLGTLLQSTFGQARSKTLQVHVENFTIISPFLHTDYFLHRQVSWLRRGRPHQALVSQEPTGLQRESSISTLHSRFLPLGAPCSSTPGYRYC